MLPESDSAALAKLTRARTELLLDWPFFGYMALRLQLLLDPTCKTVWSNGVVLGANPEYVRATTKLELMEVVAHVILKLVAGHHLRQGWRTHELWQKATNYAIAPLLLESVYRLDTRRMPKGMYEPRFKGLSAEWIYQKLLEELPPPPPEPPAGSNEAGEDEGSGSSSSEGSRADDSTSPNSARPSGAAGGQDEDETSKERGSPPCPQGGRLERPEISGEIRPLPAEENRDEHKSELNASMAEATMCARGRGLLPAGIDIAVQKELEPKVDWRSAMRVAFISGHSNPDYRMDRPNRNLLAHGIYMPSLVGESIRLLGIGVDTSASVMTYNLFDKVMGELIGIREEMHPEQTFLLECDAKVHRVQELQDGDEVKPNFRGGGGTKYEPVFQWFEENGVCPDICGYFTDGECPVPDEEPPYPVVWIVPEGVNFDPPWGTVVEVPL